MRSAVFLHGFASSPGSAKATSLAQALAGEGLALRVPDLNVPDFEHLTLTAILERARAELAACPPGPVLLIGSSLGGLAALHLLARAGPADRVDRCLLLAPALELDPARALFFPPQVLDQWQKQGALELPHHGTRRLHRVHYGLVEDLARHGSPPPPPPHVAVHLVHGRRDEVLDFRAAERFAQRCPNVTLHLVDSDHQLLEELPFILQLARRLARG